MKRSSSKTAAAPECEPPQTSVAAVNLFGLDRPRLASIVTEIGQPAYRARQLYSWLYRRRARSVDEMRTLPTLLRRSLSERFTLRQPERAERLVSRDGTIKYLFALEDDAAVESVVIPEPRRRTLCLSTQVGCPLRCAFCLSGRVGFRRNLTTAEILGQAATAMADAANDGRPWNIVVMGMGEPLLNFEATRAALRILMDPDGFGVPPRRLTLSTVGILPALKRLAEEPQPPNLAISLHAPRPDLRLALMPIEARFPMKDVIEVARRYPIPRGGRLTFEYVLIRAVNDTPREARDLARLLAGVRSKVNLIPLNPAHGIPYEPPAPEAVEAFGRLLSQAGVTVSVRRPRGRDVLAACGQLYLTSISSLPSRKPH